MGPMVFVVQTKDKRNALEMNYLKRTNKRVKIVHICNEKIVVFNFKDYEHIQNQSLNEGRED